MRIGIRAHDMEKLPLEQVIPKIHEKGFHCMHIALKKSIREFQVTDATLTPGLAMYMKELCADNKIDVAVLGCYLNLANPNKEALAKTYKTYEANIRFASILGCGVVGTETGAVNEEYKYEPANHTEEALNIFINNLRPVVEYAEKMGVIVAIEPVYKHIVCDVKRARKVLDAINSPNLRIIFDPVNVLSPDNYMRQDEIITEAFELLRDEIAVVHAKDFVIENGEIKSVRAGAGQFNYDLLMQNVKKYKPYIHVTLEDTKPEDVFEAKAHVEAAYERAVL
ncbi:sugar phosphate isomerase/epimerase [Falcatimonas sp. MSJ-15]|uniref:sugar phosphate isomerase/epimerase family protein n=1 Tax=Falcatimonas sp. MSJ-15 TaxID=2841515 RepID=UPI001C126E4B|nr:sugar phosphate isomerase/epimerase family protein [Falcatimonas sp. MSJ-15]MBU5468784.1 sugar phosphate isomerase/epimerase [Falcatimonas sp. MSJ-15]